MVITFIKKAANEMPPFDPDTDSLSKRYFAVCLTFGGNEAITVVLYDFKCNKWRFLTPGIKELVFYLIEESTN